MKARMGAVTVGEEVKDVMVVERTISVLWTSLRLVLLFNVTKHQPRCGKKEWRLRCKDSCRVQIGSSQVPPFRESAADVSKKWRMRPAICRRISG